MSPALENVSIVNLKSEKNFYGIAINMNNAVLGKKVDVKITDFVSKNDTIGLFANSLDEESVYGEIYFENILIDTAGWSGVTINNYLHIHPLLKFKKVKIINSNDQNRNTEDNPEGWVNGSGFVVARYPSTTSILSIGNVICEDLEVIDTRTPKLINTAFLCFDFNATEVLNVRIINPIRLDAIRNRYKEGVKLIDTNNCFISNIAYFEDLWSYDNPQNIVKSSGTIVRREVNIQNSVPENNTMTLINDSTNGIVIDLDKVTPRLKIYPFDNTNRYLKTTLEGSAMKILRTGGKFYAVNVSGTWENSADY